MNNTQTTESLGLHFLVEPSGPVLLPRERELLRDLQPAGVMVRSRNFLFREPYQVWLPTFRALVADVEAAVNRPNLIWSIDHEGGRVVRPPQPITRFPYQGSWQGHTEEVCTAMAAELRSLGINVTFAPCADVDGGCSVIGQRAFSKEVAVVERETRIAFDALQRGGLTAVSKHFPGNGFASADPHFGQSANVRSRAELEADELRPFRRLVQAGIKGLMTAHVVYSSLDPENPATLSKKILHDLLRQEMGFSGVIFADAVGMLAVRDLLQGEAALTKAIEATLDILVIVGDAVTIEGAVQMRDSLFRLSQKGAISQELLAASQKRIRAFMQDLPKPVVAELSPLELQKHAALAHALDPTKAWLGYQYIPDGF